MVSHDVTSLFKNIPLEQTIHLTIDLLFEAKPGLKISREDLQKLLQFATRQTNFLFNGSMYEQVDGVTMGSPLEPILANIFMGYHAKGWIKNYNYGGTLYYKRYVDDIFTVFETKDHAVSFSNYINRQHSNVKFTMETEKNGKLLFMDVLVCNKPNLITSVYRKPTYTGLLTNFFSFTPSKYKNRFIKTLLDRYYKINNIWKSFDNDLENLTKILNKNQFPTKLINKITKQYLDLTFYKKPFENKTEVKTDTRFFKLPYIGKYSNIAQKKIQNLVKTFCKDIDVKVVLTPFKISSKFSYKYPSPFHLQSFIGYKFICVNCKV